MAKVKISAIVNTRNEEKNIEDCLKCLAFCDEIIVVDMESTDDTVKLAKNYSDRIYNHPAIGYVEPARNFAIKKATGDWILIVDADERIPKTLAIKLLDLAKTGEADFVRLPRKNLVFGQWLQHSRWWPDYNIRFFKKGSVEWQDEIHSVPVTIGNGISLEPQESLAIEHHHYQTIDEYFSRALRYSNQQSKELIASGYKFDPMDLISKPLGEFMSRFFAGEGYKDGLHGFVVAILQFFSILLVYLKVWEKDNHRPVREASFLKVWQIGFVSKFRELRFWYLTTLIQHTPSKTTTFFLKLKRRLLK